MADTPDDGVTHSPDGRGRDEHPERPSGAAGSVSPERIAQRAYEIYRERGGQHGRDTDDWFRAETELTNTPS